MDRIVQIDFDKPGDVLRWQSFIAARNDTHATDRAEWRRLFRELYGIPDYSYACVEGETILGVAALYHVRSRLLGNRLMTCPFFGYGGLYADREDVRRRLVAEAEACAAKLGVDFIEWRLDRPLPPPYQVNDDFLEFDLDLAGGHDPVWDGRLSSNARQNIRKAAGHALRFSLSDDPAAVFELLCRTLRAHGTPFHGRRFFSLLAQHLRHDVRFSEVRDDGRLTAGGVVVRFKDTFSTPYIGSLRKGRERGSNYAQYWGIIEEALKQGIRRLDLGRSIRGSVHVSFKEKWGARAIPVHYSYRVLKPGANYASVSRPATIHLLATRIWRRLPLIVTRSLGPYLARQIP